MPVAALHQAASLAGPALALDGYLSALTAAVLFGIQYVPVKKHEIYDGTVFQWFMCSGILFTGVFLGSFCAGEVPRVALLDLVGGMFWTAQNMLLMPVVKLLGLGLGFAIYSATNVLSGYLVGRFGLFGSEADAGRRPWLRDAGAACLVASFALMVLVRPPEGQGERAGPQARSAISVLSRTRATSCPDLAGLAAPELAMQQQPSDIEREYSARRPKLSGLGDALLGAPQSPQVGARVRLFVDWFRGLVEGRMERAHWAIGIALVVLAGFLNSLSALPFNWWLARNPLSHKGSFVFAQALGTWMVSTALYLTYASGRKMLRYSSPPHSCIRPAFLSGFIWACGFVFMCVGIDGLGFTAGYTYAAVLPVCVSSLLSVLWFREIRGRTQIALFAACFGIQSAGVCLIAMGSQ